MFTEELDNKVNVEWEGNFYIELFPFTQKSYDEFLITDPSDPNYAGSFKELRPKYFEYLQAKGRGEDVKSPINILNTKEFSHHSRSDIDDYLRPTRCLYGGKNAELEMYFLPDIKLKSDRTEGKLAYASPVAIKEEIRKELYIGNTAGSFTFDKSINLEEINKNLQREKWFPDDFEVYLEWSNRPNRLFAEIRDNKENCLVSFTYDISSSFLSRDIHIDRMLENTIKNQINAYIQDFDYDEFKKEKSYSIINGNYYESKMQDILGEHNPMDWNFDAKPDVTLYGCATFKAAEIHQTAYYRYCDPDKITFSDFKGFQKFPLNVLNKRAIEEFKSLITFHPKIYDVKREHFFAQLNVGDYNHDTYAIGTKNLDKIIDKLIESGKMQNTVTLDMSENIKHYLDQDFTVFNMKDYGDEIGGFFIYRNLEFEFDYNHKTGELDLLYFDYKTEDPETGYYKQLELPPLMKNPAIQDMLIDQIDLQVNNFIAENRYGSLDEMLAAAELKSKETISKETKSKDEMEL